MNDNASERRTSQFLSARLAPSSSSLTLPVGGAAECGGPPGFPRLSLRPHSDHSGRPSPAAPGSSFPPPARLGDPMAPDLHHHAPVRVSTPSDPELPPRPAPSLPLHPAASQLSASLFAHIPAPPSHCAKPPSLPRHGEPPPPTSPPQFPCLPFSLSRFRLARPPPSPRPVIPPPRPAGVLNSGRTLPPPGILCAPSGRCR